MKTRLLWTSIPPRLRKCAVSLRGLDELTYAAAARCLCGAGIAYPEGIGMQGAWFCSAILLGQAEPESEHTSAYPFIFWSVKSENQPSQNGLTTRPKGTHVATIPFYVCHNCKSTGECASYRVENREALKTIACSSCGEKYIKDEGSCNSKIEVRFFHQVVDDESLAISKSRENQYEREKENQEM